MRRFAALIVAGMLSGAAPAPVQDAADYDIVIRNGHVLDGAGNPWVSADVAIDDGRIVAMGAVPGRGETEIDATGRYVAPGFIDMLDQSGHALLRDGSAANKLRMGVTTLIAGEGGTAVPADEVTGYFRQLETQGIAVNFGTYYSATQARMKAMGDSAGAPTPEQMAVMEAEVATAMRAGAFGVSTALIYPPATFHAQQDLVRLASIAGRCGGTYATHMRDESSELLAAIGEAIEIGERSGAKVEIFHLKAAYAPLWGQLMPQAIELIESARARGVDVAANMYPYRAGGTGLSPTVPTHLYEQGRDAAHEALRDPLVRARLKGELAAGPQPNWSNLVHASGGWDNVVLASAHVPEMRQYEGQSFAAIGAALGRDPADVAWDTMLAALPQRASALYFMMRQDDIDLAMRQPWVSIGTDAAASVPAMESDPVGLTHPRSYGTFPRILGDYVRERGVLTLAEAVRKMTSLPAMRMGLSDRGVLRAGLRADVVIFDADRVIDHATYADPTASPEGIEAVIVNGVLALRDGEPTGTRSGIVLRHRCEI
ncbi:N-acyl-D-amino-acid deacylase family protein [Sphingosinithalassobacter sp. LHW66-3]|uniref:N-acyl-D-amino-acid deacylase family protein n=1 Tax=Sphingosinithalassobacter sp. LHW66-3 TaxID=3424718 RepID=UPI003D6B24C6